MNKFYLIDKPLGISSFDIIRNLRKKLNIKKIGHTGTLDPLATGGVILATGNYTKLIPYLEKDKKTYEFTISLDGITESFDLAEEIKFLDNNLREKYKKELTVEKIQEILKNHFTGEIIQVPPKYSALKINGQRAYKLARDGKEVEMKSRKISIFNIEIINFNYPELELKAEVSAGTYIRSIAADLGEILGTGGYITKLRRIKIGNLDLSKSIKLENFDLENFETIDIKQLFSHMKFINLDEEILGKINNGLVVKINDEQLKNYFITGKDMFVFDGINITNIVEYNGEELIAKKKI